LQIRERLSGAVPVNKCVLSWLLLANGVVQVNVNAFPWLNLSTYLIFIVAQPESPEIVKWAITFIVVFLSD
jgi:hypothetical protein